MAHRKVIQVASINMPHSGGVPAVPVPKFNPPTAVAPGWIIIWSSEPPVQIIVRMGPEPWIPTAGFGGWEVVPRPLQVGMLIEAGVEPYQYSGSVVFDGWREQASVEHDISELMKLAHGDDNNSPGIFTIVGIPNLPATAWVIENLEFDPDMVIRHPSTMERLRQKVTLTIREYVPPTYVRLANNALGKSKGGYVLIVTKKGDTPHKIAVARKVSVKDIIELNRANTNLKPPITKANQKLKAGLRIRVPITKSKTQIKKSTSTRRRS